MPQIERPEDDPSQRYLTLSAQRALLGAVGQSVRAVSVAYRDKAIVFDALVDPDITDAEREDLQVAATELIADYPAGWTLEVEIDDADAKVQPEWPNLVYLRRTVR